MCMSEELLFAYTSLKNQEPGKSSDVSTETTICGYKIVRVNPHDLPNTIFAPNPA